MKRQLVLTIELTSEEPISKAQFEEAARKYSRDLVQKVSVPNSQSRSGIIVRNVGPTDASVRVHPNATSAVLGPDQL